MISVSFRNEGAHRDILAIEELQIHAEIRSFDKNDGIIIMFLLNILPPRTASIRNM